MYALMVARVGPVSATFKGKLTLSDINPPNSYKIAFEGQGDAAGFAKGGAAVCLDAAGEDQTRLS
jgi:carbon monoxide dehydrogenase subunit G